MLLFEVGEGDSLVGILRLWSAVDGVLRDIAHVAEEFEESGVGF